MGPLGQAGVNPYRGCAEIVRKSCNLSGVAVQSPQPVQTVIVRSPCGSCAEVARRWCGDRGATVPFLSVRPPRGARAGIVRCHLRHVYGLRTYDFSNLYNFPLNKIVAAAEPVIRTKISQPAPARPQHRGLAEAARKGGSLRAGSTGSVDASQAKCELGIMPSSHLACDGSTEPVSCSYPPFRAASARPPCGGRRRLWDFRIYGFTGSAASTIWFSEKFDKFGKIVRP